MCGGGGGGGGGSVFLLLGRRTKWRRGNFLLSFSLPLSSSLLFSLPPFSFPSISLLLTQRGFIQILNFSQNKYINTSFAIFALHTLKKMALMFISVSVFLKKYDSSRREFGARGPPIFSRK